MSTIGEMIQQHNELKSYVEQASAKFAERVKPYNEALGIIEQAILQRLNDEHLDNFKSEHGTAYKKPFFSAKVDNRDAFLTFVLHGHIEFLDARVLKEPVKEYLEKNHASPPGIATETVIRCHIRRT